MRRVFLFTMMVMMISAKDIKAEDFCRSTYAPLFIISTSYRVSESTQWASIPDQPMPTLINENCISDTENLRERLMVNDEFAWNIISDWVRKIGSLVLGALDETNSAQVNYGFSAAQDIPPISSKNADYQTVFVHYPGYISARDGYTHQEFFNLTVSQEIIKQGEFSSVSNESEATESACDINSGWAVWRHDGFHNNQQDGQIQLNSVDHVFLYGILSQHSSNYYAWDMTAGHPQQGNLSPKLKFMIAGGDSAPAESPYYNMGIIKTAPTLGQVKIHGMTHRVLFFGGGYDPVYDEDPDKKIPSKENPAKGSQIYMVDAETGGLFWWASHNNSSAPIRNAYLIHSVASTIKVMDVNQDGLTDRLYFSDWGGQLFRVDIDNENDANGDSPFFSVERITDLNEVYSGEPQGIFNQAAAAIVFGKSLFFSTMDYSMRDFIQCSDKDPLKTLYSIDLLTGGAQALPSNSSGGKNNTSEKQSSDNSILASVWSGGKIGRRFDFWLGHNGSSYFPSQFPGGNNTVTAPLIKTTYWRRIE